MFPKALFVWRKAHFHSCETRSTPRPKFSGGDEENSHPMNPHKCPFHLLLFATLYRSCSRYSIIIIGSWYKRKALSRIVFIPFTATPAKDSTLRRSPKVSFSFGESCKSVSGRKKCKWNRKI